MEMSHLGLSVSRSLTLFTQGRYSCQAGPMGGESHTLQLMAVKGLAKISPLISAIDFKYM